MYITSLWSEVNEQIFIHGANLFVIIIFALLFILTRRTNKRWSKVSDYLGKVTNTVDSVRYGNLTAKLENIEIPNSALLSESVNRMVETLRDREKMITEYQTELRRQNRFLEAAINSLSDGLVIVDEHFNILRVTAQAADWFEVKGKELIGKNLFDYITVSEELKPEKLKNDEIFLKNKPSGSFLGSTMKLNLDDKNKRYVVLIKNITSEKEIETLKEDFVATLTHDLKVPILAAGNIIDFFLDEKFGEINDKQRMALSNMKTSNNELIELVQIVLDTYKLRDNKIALFKEDIGIKSLLEESVAEMAPIAEKTGNNIVLSVQNDCTAAIDKLQMKRVIKNLIQNAISHGKPQTNIDIKVSNDDKNMFISVFDYGKGISKEDLDKIFNKYYSTVKRFRKIGTGLGLYLSKEIIKAHGGDITVSSVEGSFTEFKIQLPL
ncbi:PAS domain-containing protein [bacterium]|nr:PAS domain-containing protein [bacterium]